MKNNTNVFTYSRHAFVASEWQRASNRIFAGEEGEENFGSLGQVCTLLPFKNLSDVETYCGHHRLQPYPYLSRHYGVSSSR